MSLIKKPVFWVGVAAVAIAGFVLTAPEETPVAKAPQLKPRKSTNKALAAFTDEDFKAQFPRYQGGMTNAFRPLVLRRTGGLSGGEGAANEIPLEFTGGVAGWVYTGSAEIDGIPTALLENRASGDGVFLRNGERWKSAVVIRITPTSMGMRGPSGDKTFTLVDDAPVNQGGSTTMPEVAPVNVNPPNNMRGRIGGQFGGNNFGGGPNGPQPNIQFTPSPGGGGQIVIGGEEAP